MTTKDSNIFLSDQTNRISFELSVQPGAWVNGKPLDTESMKTAKTIKIKIVSIRS